MADDDLPPPPAFDDDDLPPPPEDDFAPPPAPGGGASAVAPPKLKGPKAHPPPTYIEDGDHPSHINEYVSAILDMWGGESSPFHGRELTTTSPDQVATAVENTFYSPASLKRAMSYHPATGDVVIASLPRTGQTAVLNIVDQLLLYKESNSETLTDRIPWIESMAFDNIPPPPTVDGRRVFKTHLSLGALKTYMKPGVKYITILRHPADLRLSFFRHLRKIHIVAHDSDNNQLFDDFYGLDDFIRVPIAPFQAGQTSGQIKQSVQSNKVAAELFDSPDVHVYEHELVEWINESRSNPKQIMVIFYEELVMHPDKIAIKMAQFLDAKKPDYKRVSLWLNGWEFPQHIVDEAKAAAAHREMMARAAMTNSLKEKGAKEAPGQNNSLQIKVPPRPPTQPRSALRLPPGWKSAKDKVGETYYYNKVLDLCQWNFPTMDQATGDGSDAGLLGLSCLNRGVKLFDPDSVQYLDQVWDYVVTSNLMAKPDSYETLYLQITGEPYPFGSRVIRKKFNEDEKGKTKSKNFKKP